MSQYNPVTNFGAKDALTSGNPLKAVKGADLTTEFAAVQVAVNSKQDASTGINAPVVVTKAATTSRASTTTLTDDPDLTTALSVAGTYKVECVLSVPPIAGGFAFNLNYSGTTPTNAVVASGVNTASGGIGTDFGNVSATVNNNVFTVAPVSTVGSGILVEAFITITTAGTLALAWAQNSSNVAASQLGAGSTMSVTKIA